MLALLFCFAAACGGSLSCASGGASSAHPPVTNQPGVPADVGSGARYAPPASLLYLSSSETGAPWRRLTAMRDRLPKLGLAEQSGGADGLVRFLVGTEIAPIGGPLDRVLGNETAVILVSSRFADSGSNPVVPDLLFYQTVTDRQGLERWLDEKGNVSHARTQGDFAIYPSSEQSAGGGAWAVSDGVALWASTEARVRQAVTLGEGSGPTLADDPGFRAAMARVDARDAAMVGYSRGDLVDELSRVEFNGAVTRLAAFSSTLGLHDCGFAIGAGADGFWVRGFPKGGTYVPGATSTQSLLGSVPGNAAIFAVAADAGAVLGAADSVARGITPGDGSVPTVSAMVRSDFGLSDAQLHSLSGGQIAIWLGDQSGAALAVPDPVAAEAAARAAAAFRNDLQVTRRGSVVEVRTAGQRPDPGPITGDPRFRQLATDAGLPRRVSLLAFIHAGGWNWFTDSQQRLTASGSLGRILVWTIPRAEGYEFEVYAELPARR